MIFLLWLIPLLLFALWIAGSVYLYVTQESKYYPANGHPFGESKELDALGARAVTREREGLKLRWYEIDTKQPLRGWALVLHGNAGGADERHDYASGLTAFGLNVILAEYPGYAGDHSPTSEWPILRHSLAIYDELAPRVGGLPLFLLGESLGTGPATFVATRRPCTGLILVTPYPSMADVAAFRYPLLPVKPLTIHPVRADIWARYVSVPVQVLHGTADETVSYALGQRQSKNFRNLKEFVTIEGGGHTTLRYPAGGPFWQRMGAFVAACVEGKML